MKIATRVVLDMETLDVLVREEYEYHGPVDMACGPTSQQQGSANNLQGINALLSNTAEGTLPQTTAFWQNQMNNGLPYFGAQSQYSTSTLGQQEGQQKAQMNNQLAGYGSALPSGFAQSADRSLDASAAENFDQNQMQLLQQQQQAKNTGAQQLNPLPQLQSAGEGDASIFNSQNLSSNFWSNLIGGLIPGVAQLGSSYIANDT